MHGSQFSGGSRSVIASPRSIPKHEAAPKPEPKAERPNGYATLMATRSCGYSIAPGETAQYRHKTNRDLVTVSRFAGPELYPDETAAKVLNAVTKVQEFPNIRVSTGDCTVKAPFHTAFLFPVFALDLTYEREPETAVAA